MKKRSCFVFLVAALLTPIWAMAGVIKVVVKDSKTMEPMAGALVTVVSDILPEGVIVLADENGAYNIKDLSPGTYSITASYAGAESKSPQSVTLSEGGSAEITLLLDASKAVGEVVTITASRIPRPNIDASVPVTSVTAAELMSTGEVSVGDKIALLPSFVPSFTSQNSGRFIGTAGLNILDLRGQGTTRTLVLQNGRRHVGSVPGTSEVDVNTIPNDLLERVDVVTGGNSAVYGSDAIAGVVNFITKRDYEGLGVRSQYGISSRGDRPTFRVSATGGKNFLGGRGNVAGNVEFSLSDPLYFRDRAFTGASTGRSQFQPTENTAFPTAEPPEGRGEFDTTFLTGVKNMNISTGGLFASTCPAPTATNAERRRLNCSGVFNSAGTSEFGNGFVFTPDGRLVPNSVLRDFRPFGSQNGQGGYGSTLRETGLLQAGVKNLGVNLLSSYKFVDAFRVFLEAKYVRTNAVQEGQPTFSSGALNPAFRLDNPFLTDQARSLLTASLAPGATTFTMTRFNTDFAGRGEDHYRDLYRVVVGADGNFFDTWRYETAFNYGRVNTFYTTRGNVNLARFTNAVNAVRDPANNIVCAINTDADPSNDDPNCVPLNLFGEGAPSKAALSYIIHNSTRDEFAEQLNWAGFMSGDLGKLFSLPGGPVAFSLGSEWRRETSFSAFDAFTRNGGTFLNSIANFEPPAVNVIEGFGEIRVPVVADILLLNELTLEGALRVSHYTTGGTGTVWTGNAGAVYSPVNGVRLRGGYAVAVRAPTQGDLFGSDSQTFLNGLADPCGQQNITANPNRVANCAAAGVPTTQTFDGTTEPFTNRPASGISGLSGGNPDLTAEKSNSFTVGAVLTPTFAPGLVFTLDYFSIDLNNAINTLGAQTIINQCYDSPDGIDNQFCRAVFRNPDGTFKGQGNVLHGGSTIEFPRTGQSFRQGPFNYARQNTTGIDFDLGYSRTFLGDWRFNGRAIISYLINRDNYTSTTEPNRLTQVKFNVGSPEINGQLRLALGYKNFDVSWNTRLIGPMTVVTYSQQNSEQGRPPTNLDASPIVWYPTVTYNDLRGSVKIDALESRFFVGVDNIFDQLPPLDRLGTGAGDSIYTNTGRFIYFGVDFSI